MKKFVYFFLFAFLVSFSLLGVSLFAPLNANAAVSSYDYQVVEKSPDAHLKAGENIILWTKIKNTGSKTWYGSGDNAIHLGTTNYQDRTSSFYTQNNWISPNRAHWTNYGPYENGDIAEFGFYATAPSNLATGTYQECFYPVVENITWMWNEKICWNINVVNEDPKLNYNAETVPDFRYYDINLQPGETYDIVFKAKNTGGRDWTRHSNTPLHLATTSPNDRSSDIYHSSWISQNRPTVVEESVVKPGEVGTFNFTIQTPSTGSGNQMFIEHFWLVAEHDTWFQDPTPYYPLFAVIAHVDYGDVDYSEENSTILISNENIVANGVDSAVVTIRLCDDQNQPIKYNSVELNIAEYYPDTMEVGTTSYTLITDFRGEAIKEIRSTKNTDYAFTFKYKTFEEYPDWVYLTARKDIEVTSFDPKNSAITVSKKEAKPTGYDFVNLTIEARDKNNHPMPNQKVKLTTTGCLLTDGNWHDCWDIEPEYLTTDSSGNAYKQINSYFESVYLFSASIENKYFLQTPIVEYIDNFEDNVDYDATVKIKENKIVKSYIDSDADVYNLVDQIKKDIYHNLDTMGNSCGVYSMTKDYEDANDTIEIVFDPHTSIIHDRPVGLDMYNDIQKVKSEVNRIVILFHDRSNTTASFYYDQRSDWDIDKDYDTETDDERRWSFIYGGEIPKAEIQKLVDKQ